MEFEDQILFFFSALGGFNGLFLSLYFGFIIKNKNIATYFLAALLFVISVRVIKSVFLTFYPETSSLFIQVGLTACFLIGPFLYLYTRIATRPDSIGKWQWLLHIVPIIVFMIVTGILYPYNEYWHLWQRRSDGIFGYMLLFLWTIYLIAAIYQSRRSFLKLFSKTEKLSNLDYWIINIVVGCFLIWLAYNTVMYTSYIVGALSFSFTLYVSLMIWFFKRRQHGLSFLSPAIKYQNKVISDAEITTIADTLPRLFTEEKVHLNSDLKLLDVANRLEVKRHTLSQYLNDTVGQSFSNFINGYRVESAIEMLQSNQVLTIEGIGNECGFKSNTSFYNAFKKHKGMTPAQFKKSLK
ncbi:helix-turn-helix domain-containing protein [Spongiivirga citrea]|uniref:Helix-turn-helix domain-containing protein n=1 Tax=Spongiivirga citrea TaxID=1481457 RepID=A0A6M0CGI1_9FLAO|nr:AraC family transcriptional regulator [Spongiivirga citrea]NER16582.1 helix-turn-helix domain-containing protein [Spongiivirga citrea]